MRIDPLKLMPAGGMLAPSSNPRTQSGEKSFSQLLAEALGETNKLQHEAAAASMRLAAGQVQDIAEVTIAAEKAAIALQLTMQVRNKVVEAYQEVMRMQV